MGSKTSTELVADFGDIDWDQVFLDQPLLSSNALPTTADGDSILCRSSANYDEYLSNTDLSVFQNDPFLPNVPIPDSFDEISLYPRKSPIDTTFQTASLQPLDNNYFWNPFQSTFNHIGTQAHETYPFPVQPPVHMSSPTGANLPSISPPAQSPTTNTNTTDTMSQSTSTTPSSDPFTSTTPSDQLTPQNKYTCTLCPETFSKRFELNKHIPIHTLPHPCNFCPHRTARKRDLNRHITAKHKNIGPSGPKPAFKHTCPVESCKRAFERSDHLLRHMRRKHPGYNAHS